MALAFARFPGLTHGRDRRELVVHRGALDCFLPIIWNRRVGGISLRGTVVLEVIKQL